MPEPAPGWLRDVVRKAGDMEPGWFSRYLAVGTQRASAVLVLAGPRPDGRDGIVLTQRAATLRSHAGQVAFPGGKIDPGEDAIAAALREGWEETGMDPASVDVLGTLPGLHIPVTRYDVVPVVAWWREPGPLVPGHPDEVARVVQVAVDDLVDPGNRVLVRHHSGVSMPGFLVDGLVVWGFTAGVLDRVLELSGLARPWDRARVHRLAD